MKFKVLLWIANVALILGVVHAGLGGMAWWHLAGLHTPIDAEYMRQMDESVGVLLGGLTVVLLACITNVLIAIEQNTRRG